MDYSQTKGVLENERSNSGDFFQAYFAWVFVKQRNVYHSRRNGNYGKPRGFSDNTDLNSRNKPKKDTWLDRPNDISETICNNALKSFDSLINPEKVSIY